MLRSFGLSLAILVCLASAAQATPTIVVGNYNTDFGANNVIQIFVTGGDPVQGLNFIMDINDNQPGGGVITAVDLLTGTIFAANNTGQGGSPHPPATKIKQTVVTASGTVSANGLLATVTISMIGVPSGFYDLRMTGMATAGGGSTTNFAVDMFGNPITANITNGHIGDFDFPEPPSIVLGLFALAGLSAIANRKRRTAASHFSF